MNNSQQSKTKFVQQQVQLTKAQQLQLQQIQMAKQNLSHNTHKSVDDHEQPGPQASAKPFTSQEARRKS